MKKKKKVMFISSTGGHLSEMLELEELFPYYDTTIVTEKTKSNLYFILCSFRTRQNRRNVT